jgi:putative flippase GtrA
MIRAQFLIYVGVGILSALIDIGIMQGLIVLGVDLRLAVTLGFATGLVFNYVCHQRITFKATTTTAATLVRFSLVVAANYLLTMACVLAAVHWFDSALAGKLVSLPLVAVNGFLWGKYWIFR